MRHALRTGAVITAISIFALCGCETFKPTPVVSQARAVYPVAGVSGIVTVSKDLTFDDSVRRTFSITVPRGVYKLEAQDDDYFYYALAGLMDRSTFDGKNMVDHNVFCGGLMIAKRPDVSFPAGVYRSDGSLNRMMIWRFGAEFMKMKGEFWTESVGK